MAFGIIHYMFLVDTIVMLVCVLLLLRRYLAMRNLLTLIFTTFLLTFTVLCLTYFLRGLYALNSAESILIFRISLLPTVFAPPLLATFIFYPLILDKGGFVQAKMQSVLLVVLWVLALFSSTLVLIGEASHRFSVLNMDVYSVTFGAISYGIILLPPILTALICSLMFIVIANRETERFYRIRAILLFVGWFLALLGQLTLLVESLMILNPVLFGAGAILMAIAILRQAPA